MPKPHIPRAKNWKLPKYLVSKPSNAGSFTPEAPRRATKPPTDPTPETFIKHREAMKKEFPQGWAPPKKLSRDAIDSLRSLHTISPETFTTSVLSERFKISPEAVRRILKSKWVPEVQRMKELQIRDQKKREEKRKTQLRKEWAEGVESGVLRVKDEDKLELN